jgi:hypothetical protein
MMSSCLARPSGEEAEIVRKDHAAREHLPQLENLKALIVRVFVPAALRRLDHRQRVAGVRIEHGQASEGSDHCHVLSDLSAPHEDIFNVNGSLERIVTFVI